MTTSLFEQHRATLEAAVQALESRTYWAAFNEMPSPKVYGEEAPAQGKAAYDAYLGKRFELNQPGITSWTGKERSPYGTEMHIEYPVCDVATLINAGEKAMTSWQALGLQGRMGVCVEMLQQLNKRSFEIAHAVMQTTGQGWMMAFQAGGPHAQDRGLESVAAAYRVQSLIAPDTHWEKPQGKNPALVMKKHFEPVGRGVAVVIGCGTFPTWNTYPGLFAALATGNAVIIKPHTNAILPAAITVKVLRDVLQAQGVDPNLVSLAVTTSHADTQKLVTDPAVRMVDFTGGNAFGQWLLDNCKQAQVYAEMAGVNHVVIDSTDAYKAMLRNLAFTLSLYSGQMCTTPQAILVPAGGIQTEDGHKSYDDVCKDLSAAVTGFLSKPEVAHAVLGAIQASATMDRINEAASGAHGEVILAPQKLENPEFPNAEVHTPVIIACDASNEHAYMEERFGPISFVVKTADTAASIALSERLTKECGALTASIYSTDQTVIDSMIASTQRSKVALSINLTGGVFVNQSTAFSDFHGTGGNPGANASYTDFAYVANRFVVVQYRQHA